MLENLNLTNQDVMVLGILISAIVIVGIICIVLVLKKNKKEEKVEIEELEVKPDINMSLATSNIPELSEEAPSLEEELEETIEEVEEEINEELEIEQDNKNRSSIEDVLSALNQDLERQKYENIDRYEEEQEENAVISYQELLDRKMALNKEAELQSHTKEDSSEIIKKTTTKFSNSEFISPVFGRLESTMEYPTLKKVVEEEIES